MSKKYIHYGNNEFCRDLFTKIRNREMFVKPWGGLWASPVDARNGWKDWCINEHFHVDRLKESFTFTLSDTANVLHLYDVEQLRDLPQLTMRFMTWTCLDFEQLLADGYDAVELHLSDEKNSDGFLDGLYWELYGWDCDSILIMNPEVVVYD